MNSGYPDPLPQPVPAMPSVATDRPQSLIFFGILLALVGIGLEAIGQAVSYVGSFIMIGTITDLILRMEIETAALASAVALTGVGLFLVFFNIAQVRPATKPWTIGAALVLLATGIAGAILQVLSFLAFSALMSERGPIATAARLVVTISAVRAAVAVAGSIATIIGLFGVTRATVYP